MYVIIKNCIITNYHYLSGKHKKNLSILFPILRNRFYHTNTIFTNSQVTKARGTYFVSSSYKTIEAKLLNSRAFSFFYLFF